MDEARQGFEDSDAGERLRRYQLAGNRTLMRILEILRRRHREADQPAPRPRVRPSATTVRPGDPPTAAIEPSPEPAGDATPVAIADVQPEAAHPRRATDLAQPAAAPAVIAATSTEPAPAETQNPSNEPNPDREVSSRSTLNPLVLALALVIPMLATTPSAASVGRGAGQRAPGQAGHHAQERAPVRPAPALLGADRLEPSGNRAARVGQAFQPDAAGPIRAASPFGAGLRPRRGRPRSARVSDPDAAGTDRSPPARSAARPAARPGDLRYSPRRGRETRTERPGGRTAHRPGPGPWPLVPGPWLDDPARRVG